MSAAPPLPSYPDATQVIGRHSRIRRWVRVQLARMQATGDDRWVAMGRAREELASLAEVPDGLPIGGYVRPKWPRKRHPPWVEVSPEAPTVWAPTRSATPPKKGGGRSLIGYQRKG